MLCLFEGGKQQKETKITISTRKKNEHNMPSSSRVYRTETHTPLRVQPLPFAIWLKCRCFQLPPRPTLERHLDGLACVSRTSPPGVGRSVPGTLGSTGTSVGYYGEPGVLRDHGGSGCLYSFGTGGYPACYQCGVASAQCGGTGSPGAVVPLCQVTLLASFPSLHHACHGSLVTPSVCFWTPPLCLPVPVCVMCDVTTCGFKANQSVCTHEMSFVCFVTEKGFH